MVSLPGELSVRIRKYYFMNYEMTNGAGIKHVTTLKMFVLRGSLSVSVGGIKIIERED